MNVAWFNHVVALWCVVVIGLVSACSPPMGWEHKEMADRLREATFVVYGQIEEVRMTSPPGAMYRYYNITTSVHCVLKNGIDANVEKTIYISTDIGPGLCIDNSVGLEEGQNAIIQLAFAMNNDDESDEPYDTRFYRFSNVNVQGARYEADNVTMAALTDDCSLGLKPQPPLTDDDEQQDVCRKLAEAQSACVPPPPAGELPVMPAEPGIARDSPMEERPENGAEVGEVKSEDSEAGQNGQNMVLPFITVLLASLSMCFVAKE